ncbi:PAS domain-containing protein [Noviherbaspirillum aerium]|uniref:PAS domain-containing protein n=1 Tax=Noviherbaspirillum aerium TaxID=2588497 RepID=UPI00124DC7D7|nr:PAS domain-containing protein [Noviherbaspirillum aerium]
MIFQRSAAGSLTRRFAVASAALATFALLLTVVSSWWLVSEQHITAMRIVSKKEADFHAATVSASLHAVASRMNEVANSSILATGLVDSAGRETYLAPYLTSIRQINGVPIQILFTDFAGTEISSNGLGSFNEREMAWLRKHLETGREVAEIMDSSRGAELIAVKMLSYSRTQTPEGALIYKLVLSDLRPNEMAQLTWSDKPHVGSGGTNLVTVPVSMPQPFQHLHFGVVEPLQPASARELAPQFAIIAVIALALAGTVLVLGARLALRLTHDLRRLEVFSRSVVDGGLGTQRAATEGSTEVASLAGSINHMLDRLYQQHAQLQEERERFLQLANTIPQLAWIAGPDGKIHWYNDRWYEYTGTSPEQMKEFGWRIVHHPAMQDTVFERMRELIAQGQPFQMTFPLRGADGEFRPFFTSAAPLRDAGGRIMQWFGTNTDVSQIEQAERAVRESEERLREGLVAARMAVWDWDLSNDAIRFSPNAPDIFGDTWDSGTTAWRAVHPDDQMRLQRAVDKAVAEQSQFNQVVRMIRPDNGNMVWIESRGKAVTDQSGKVRSIRGISIDVTVRKNAEEALRLANQRKDEFLAMLAHELRNPLAPISTAAEILKLTGADAQRLRQTSEIITRQVDHMTSLINDLLDVSRVTRGLVKVEKEPVRIADVVAGAVEQVKPLIETRRHRLNVQPVPPQACVLGDRKRLVQIVTNLLNNAAKYTGEGGEIVLMVAVDADQIEISVRDTGIGISPALLPHVFELFTQAERTPDRSQGGLGLGLALVRSLVELHDGVVEAYSEGTDKGSLFTVKLPRLGFEIIEPSHVPVVDGARVSKGMHVMIVDDNIDAAHSLAVLMEAEGYRVSVEYCADKALERAMEDPPQVFLLDIGLPETDGYTLARQLRSLPSCAHALLIAVTGYGRKEDIDRSQAAGFDHHLVKPATRQALVDILARSHAAPDPVSGSDEPAAMQ